MVTSPSTKPLESNGLIRALLLVVYCLCLLIIQAFKLMFQIKVPHMN